MNGKYHDTKPQGASLAVEPIGNPPEAQPAGAPQNQSMGDLLRQIGDLYIKGDDPARLREVLTALDVAHRRRINEQLAILREQDLEELVDLLERRSQAVKVLKAATKRPNLTMRETRLLQDFVWKEFRRQRQWLVSEKKRLEQKRQLATLP